MWKARKCSCWQLRVRSPLRLWSTKRFLCEWSMHLWRWSTLLEFNCNKSVRLTLSGSDWLDPTECRLTGEWALERVQRSRTERDWYDLYQRMYWRYRSQGGKGQGPWKGRCLLITCAERMSTWRRISACRPSSMKLFQTKEMASMSISLIISCVTPRRSISLRPLILTDWNCLWRRWRVMTGRCRYIPLSFIGTKDWSSR